MRTIAGLTCSFVFVLLCPTIVFAQAPLKPIKACSDEFTAREADLKDRHITASQFFHECWWHTARGHDTTIPDAQAPTTVVAEQPRAEKLAKAPQTETAGGKKPFKARRVDGEHVASVVKKPPKAVAKRATRVASINQPERKRANEEAKQVKLAATAKRPAAVRGRRFATAAAPTRERPFAGRSSEAIPATLPQGTRMGEQAWIAGSGTRPRLAVIVGTLSQKAEKGAPLHCWDQQVMYSKGDRWGEATVCDGSEASNAPATWFVDYDYMPRVGRRVRKRMA